MNNPYAMLGIKQTATDNEIRKALKKCIELHCGSEGNYKNSDGEYLQQVFIKAAKSLLDPEKRREIDHDLEVNQKLHGVVPYNPAFNEKKSDKKNKEFKENDFTKDNKSFKTNFKENFPITEYNDEKKKKSKENKKEKKKKHKNKSKNKKDIIQTQYYDDNDMNMNGLIHGGQTISAFNDKRSRNISMRSINIESCVSISSGYTVSSKSVSVDIVDERGIFSYRKHQRKTVSSDEYLSSDEDIVSEILGKTYKKIGKFI